MEATEGIAIACGLPDRDAAAGRDSASAASTQRYAAIACVAAIHVVLFWSLAGMRFVTPPVTDHDLRVALFNAPVQDNRFLAPPVHWSFQPPEEVLVPEPEIIIASNEEAPVGIDAAAMTQRLAPRLDPAFVNERPELPVSLRPVGNAASVVLRILVRTDGGVAEAMIAKSSGNYELDRTTANYVTTNWRYLPASVNGQPIEAWTTVIVRFATS